jgi:hypothetical protein
VDALLEDEAGKRHLATSQRPPLDRCSDREFEKDLVAFLRARGEDRLGALVKEARITW